MRKKQHETEFIDPPLPVAPVAEPAPPADEGERLTLEDEGTIELEPGLVTDDGMPYAWLDYEHLMSRDGSRRRMVRLDTRTFNHVSETDDGKWIYRLDR
jgi:hypothetical protein